jgi:hypothetical protein
LDRKINNVIGLGLGLVLALIFIVSFAKVGLTEERNGGGLALPEHYPDRFTGIGRIDRLAEEEIVIDDSLYTLAPYVTYHTPTAMNVSNIMFRAGNLVGFLTNSEGQIISLWFLKQDRN